MGQGSERRRGQCGNGHKSVARMQSRMLHSNPRVSPPSGTAAPQQRPACSGPLGAKAATQGVSVTVQSQEPPRRGAAGPRQGPVKPNTGTTVPPRLGSQAKKHQPKGLSRARLQNAPTHSSSSMSATSTPSSRPHRRLPGVTALAPSRPRFSLLCRRLPGPTHPWASQHLPCPAQPTSLLLNPKSPPDGSQHAPRGPCSHGAVKDRVPLSSFDIYVVFPSMKQINQVGAPLATAPLPSSPAALRPCPGVLPAAGEGWRIWANAASPQWRNRGRGCWPASQ